MRDNQTDTMRAKDVSFVVDMSPTTLLEQNMMNGFERTTRPVGQAAPVGDNVSGSGSRGTTDAIAAAKLGLPVINKK